MRGALLVMALSVVFCVLTSDPSFAQTVDRRLDALENKTDYYKKRNKIVNRSYKRTTVPQACPDSIEFTVDPAIAQPGTSHGWLTATVRYQGAPQTVFVNWGIGGFPCGKSAPALSSGTVVLKQFCSFNANPGDLYRVSFGAGDVDNTCSKIAEIGLELKITNIEMIEPE